ncbi:MAG: lipopolysaccharide biosynthesis protein [Bacteroidaceae bacterium]|nr:lipopolysaccharide biosynthesis protein [Bacteroidaceae bacterium]
MALEEKEFQRKTRSAFVWNMIDRIGSQLISATIGIALARMLGAAEYGLTGALAIFIALSQSITDSGFSAALVRKQKISEADYNTVFYYNLFISILLYIIGYLGAPTIAQFFNEPVLIPIARVLFIVFIFNALCLIQNAKMVKEIDFRKVATINVCAIVISGVIALIMATNGYGVWALVAQITIQAFIKMVMQWVWGGWRPRAIFSWQSFKELFAFSSNILLANILNVLFLNIYSAIIGRLYSSRDLGYYSQANKWSDMGVTTLYGIIQNSTYTLFSAIQDDRERLLRSYRKTMKLTAFITFPALLALALTARPFILILLGDKWETSIPMFSLLLMAGIFTVLTTLNGNYIRIEGTSSLILRLEIFKVILFIIVLALTWHLPILQLLWGLVATRAIVYLVSIVFIGRRIGYSWHQQILDIMPSCATALLMVCFAYPVQLFIDNIYLLFVVQIGICIAFYLTINRYIQNDILNELIFNIKKIGK